MSHTELTIDLNCDMGELPALYADGTEEALMQQISSANIACGAHAGSPESMENLIKLATKYGVAIGAHISYPDRQNFGRKTMPMGAEAIADTVYLQIATLAEIAARSGAQLHHVKPHGALYHDAQSNVVTAAAIAKAVRRVDPRLILVEQALSPVLALWFQVGVPVVAEAFADRTYESDGKLRSRELPQALISDPSLAAEQAVRIVRERMVVAYDGSRLRLEAQTICIHGDTPGAVQNARAIRAALIAAGVRIAAAETRNRTH